MLRRGRARQKAASILSTFGFVTRVSLSVRVPVGKHFVRHLPCGLERRPRPREISPPPRTLEPDPMQRLILLDIDGTILDSNGAAARPFRRALEAVFGTSGPRRGYSFAGRTDPQIARDLLRLAGIDADLVAAQLDRIWPVYLEGLRAELATAAVTVFPGVRELIERADADESTVLGLLTGNVVDGARLKLAAAGIDFDRFRVGAFGSDHANRTELPAVAIDRAERMCGHRFQGKSVVIVGDTPLDIACGEHLGVRTIAVATGSYGVEELSSCRPDHVFESLAGTEAVWRAISK
jgi:phosphoglycolate phosphatase